MRYTKTVDLWEDGVAEKLRTGELVLQSGQWVTCGSNVKSIYDSATQYHIVAFHGQTAQEAGAKYTLYKERQKKFKRR